MKIIAIPISPYSEGDSNLAKTRLTKKLTPCPAMASAADQPTPVTVLDFNDDDIKNYNSISACGNNLKCVFLKNSEILSRAETAKFGRCGLQIKARRLLKSL
jgi:hypothetical protein